ncbi:MAG TPA: glutamyl-tRNA reductase [Terriglobales bacterium]|nr:glutamyl-tRNA reductase [Terriglobales bacterium]
MTLLLLGISHHSAPIDERERLAIPPAGLEAALRLLAAEPGVREGLILSTCNRVEVVAHAEDNGSAVDLRHWLARATGLPAPPDASLFYQLRGNEVARHLFRVAASLDSVVVGEPQILGQLKYAYAQAQAVGLVGAELDALLPRAFHAAKRVRAETGIAAHPVSVSQAAVDLARQIFGNLSQKTVLLIGTGAMGSIAARYLLRQGAARLLVTNRTFASAQALAAKHHGDAFPLEQLREQGEHADVVIACTGSPHPLISKADAGHFLSRRRGRPMLFLDLAVPRDVEPSVHQLENAFVYNVDDLDRVVRSNLAERAQEAVDAEVIIEAELRLYAERRQARDLAPTLAALQTRAEALRTAEWARVRGRLGPLTPDQEQAAEALTRSLMQKWLHQPMVQLKLAQLEAGAADRDALLQLVRRLFDL